MAADPLKIRIARGVGGGLTRATEVFGPGGIISEFDGRGAEPLVTFGVAIAKIKTSGPDVKCRGRILKLSVAEIGGCRAIIIHAP